MSKNKIIKVSSNLNPTKSDINGPAKIKEFSKALLVEFILKNNFDSNIPLKKITINEKELRI